MTCRLRHSLDFLRSLPEALRSGAHHGQESTGTTLCPYSELHPTGMAPSLSFLSMSPAIETSVTSTATTFFLVPLQPPWPPHCSLNTRAYSHLGVLPLRFLPPEVLSLDFTRLALSGYSGLCVGAPQSHDLGHYNSLHMCPPPDSAPRGQGPDLTHGIAEGWVQGEFWIVSGEETEGYTQNTWNLLPPSHCLCCSLRLDSPSHSLPILWGCLVHIIKTRDQ